MANLQKHSQLSMGHMTAHFERRKDENGEHIKYSNEQIDTSRSDLNYNLAPDRKMKQVDYIKQRTSEVYCFNRADVKKLATWTVTLPKNQGLEERAEEFFKETYKFLKERYGGEKNVVSSYVHMDETTPHMHFAFIPVVKDPKRGFKVSAKQKLNRKDLQSFHKDLEKHLENYFGYEVGILNQATKNGNKSIQELKHESAVKEMDQINSLKTQKNALQNDFKRLSEVQVEIDEIDQIKGKSKLFNKSKITVKKKDMEKLKEVGKSHHILQKRNEKLEKDLDKKQVEVTTLAKTNRTLKNENHKKQVKLDQTKVNLGQLKSDIKDYLSAFNANKDFEKFREERLKTRQKPARKIDLER